MGISSKVIKAKVDIECEGEHHMGAQTITFKLDKNFRGVNKFYTTNGEAFFDDKKPYLIIYDAVIILIFDYIKKEVYNIETKKPELFRCAKIEDGILTYSVNNYKTNENKTITKDLKQEKLTIGFGKVINGKMPSAL